MLRSQFGAKFRPSVVDMSVSQKLVSNNNQVGIQAHELDLLFVTGKEIPVVLFCFHREFE